MMPLGYVIGAANLVGAPFGRTPVQGLAPHHDVAYGPDSLFNWRVRVRPMAEDEIDVIELQTCKRSVDGVMQIFAIERLMLVRAFVKTEEKFCRHDITHARPRKFLQRAAHDFLRCAFRIDLGVVEEIDTVIPRCRK